MKRLVRACMVALCVWVVGGQALAVTYLNASTTYSWIDPATHTKVSANTAPYNFNKCGTTVPILDDTISDLIPIGFNFLYGSTTYTQVRIETNGRLQFGNANCGAGTQSVGPPQTYTRTYPDATMTNTMKAFGVDLDPTNLVERPNYPTAANKTSCTSTATCYISFATIGSSPNRQFVVSWVNVPEWVTNTNTSGSFTFQIILNENGTFVYQYKQIVHGGTGTAQVGWELTTTDFSVISFGAATEPGAGAAILFYVPAANPLAEFRFEQGAWSAGGGGQVSDSGGLGLHGVAFGAAQAVSGGKVCRGANIPANTSAGTVNAIRTGLRFADSGVSMQGQGTLMFWFKANTNWNDGTARQLVDATLTSGNWFSLTKTGTGTLYFQATGSDGVVAQVETGAQSIAAGTWTHIAVSWNFNAIPGSNNDYLQIFVNGQAPTKQTFTSSGTLAILDYVHAGDNPSGFTGTKGTVNSADGVLDELRFYNFELNQGQVLSASTVTTTCATFTIHHLEIQSTNWSGNACAPSSVTVRACANAACTTLYTQGLVATMSATGLATVWDSSSGGSTLTIGSGQSSTTKSFYTAPGTVTLGATGTGVPAAITSATTCNGSGGSCQWTTANGGLRLTVPNSGVITAGKPTAVTVQALQSVSATPGSACVPVQNLASQSLRFWAGATSPASFTANSTSEGVTVGGIPQMSNALAGSYSGATTSAPGTTVTGFGFDSQATTTVYLKHMDVGQFDVTAALDVAASSTSPADTLTGTATVTSIPVGYGVRASSVTAPAAVQTDCATYPTTTCDTAAGGAARVASAGDSFSTRVIAAIWTLDTDTDLSDNPVAPSYSGSVSLAPSLVGPVGGSAGALGTTSVNLTSGSNTTSTQLWRQSGAMKILATGTYLSQSIAGQSAVLGRFSPKNFVTLLTTQGCGTFTYSGQPMTTVTVRAMDAGSTQAVTGNYKGDFARLTTLTDASGSTAGAISANTIAAGGFSAGIGTASPVYTFTAKATAPVTLNLRASDGEVNSSGATEASPSIRSGRVRLFNAYGSERLAAGLPLPVTIEFYDAQTAETTGWRTGTDTCTVIAANQFAYAFAGGSFAACRTAGTAVAANPMPSLTLAQPNGNVTGWVDVTLNLGASVAGNTCTSTNAGTGATGSATTANAPWLQFDWNGTGATNPTARATFGVFKSPLIYRRENY